MLERIRRLRRDKQEALEHFVEDIEIHGTLKTPRRNLKGALAPLNLHLTEQDIDEARREMWGNSPRSDI
ncbi:MAG: hypothetical protein ACREDR_34265 [Blastocatellia bacterium]